MTMISSYRVKIEQLRASRVAAASRNDFRMAREYSNLICHYLRLAQEEERKCHEKEDAAQGQKTLGSIREDAAQWQKTIDSIMSDWKF